MVWTRVCCVPNCRTKKGDNISFHQFPKDETCRTILGENGKYIKGSLRKIWEDKLRIKVSKDRHPSGVAVCCLHFKKSDFNYPTPFAKKIRLKRNAVPSQNLPPADMPFRRFITRKAANTIKVKLKRKLKTDSNGILSKKKISKNGFVMVDVKKILEQNDNSTNAPTSLSDPLGERRDSQEENALQSAQSSSPKSSVTSSAKSADPIDCTRDDTNAEPVVLLRPLKIPKNYRIFKSTKPKQQKDMATQTSDDARAKIRTEYTLSEIFKNIIGTVFMDNTERETVLKEVRLIFEKDTEESHQNYAIFKSNMVRTDSSYLSKELVRTYMRLGTRNVELVKRLETADIHVRKSVKFGKTYGRNRAQAIVDIDDFLETQLGGEGNALAPNDESICTNNDLLRILEDEIEDNLDKCREVELLNEIRVENGEDPDSGVVIYRGPKSSLLKYAKLHNQKTFILEEITDSNDCRLIIESQQLATQDDKGNIDVEMSRTELEKVSEVEVPNLNCNMLKSESYNPKIPEYVNQNQEVSIKLDESSDITRKSIEKVDNFLCVYCTIIFDEKDEFLSHMQEKHSKNKLRLEKEINDSLQVLCEICGETMKYKCLRSHNRIQHTLDKKWHECLVCHKIFGGWFSLTRHLKHHYLIKKFSCSKCDKRFTKASYLHSHIQICHVDPKEWKHICTICDRRFSTKGNLNSHMLRHSLSNPIKCDFCKRRFIDSWKLQRHLRYCQRKMQFEMSEHVDSADGENELYTII